MDLTRRRLLGIGLVGTAALALAGVGLGLRPGVQTAPETELLVLSPTQFSVLAALVFAATLAAHGPLLGVSPLPF